MRMFPGADKHDIDGYDLFTLLQNGDAIEVAINGKAYTLQFVGSTYGSNNWLEVNHPDGTVGKWGWGWYPETVFRALDDLAEGKHSNYKPYQSKEEGEK